MHAKSEQLARCYSAAWNAHDIDAILALHDTPSTFHAVGVTEPTTGHTAIREVLTALFDMWPDIEFAPRRTHAYEELIVAEYTTTATLAHPLPLGATTIYPSQRPITFDGVDFIPVNNGRVTEKISYLDTLAIQQQLTSDQSQPAPSSPG